MTIVVFKATVATLFIGLWGIQVIVTVFTEDSTIGNISRSRQAVAGGNITTNRCY